MIGTFTDANPQAPQGSSSVDDFLPLPAPGNGGSIVVNWGDGTAAETLTAANIAVSGSNNGAVYTITDSHDYTEEGTYAYTIVVTDDGGATTTISGSAIIADAPLTPVPLADQPTVTPGRADHLPDSGVWRGTLEQPRPLFSGPVAEFTDANPLPPTGSSVDRRLHGHDRLGRRHTAHGRHDRPALGRPANLRGDRFPHLRHRGSQRRYWKLPDPGLRRRRRWLQADHGHATGTLPAQRSPTTRSRVTGELNPASDSGLSTGTPDVTNVTQPDFFGTVLATLPGGTTVAEGYANVTVFATNLRRRQPSRSARSQAGSDGAWNIKSTVALPDGITRSRPPPSTSSARPPRPSPRT